ncbi:hypothetical protein INT44_001360 [Umbelopsis vinacea]|uniref:RRM domain-containing protein n=1 Tax=Umbelopsis vinacea TaxID=44442 RepID=A0A8H7QAP4_9FUNG|nr:hypothetical protein INT44_001360 [Umbelopsis vinacea]
MDAIDNSLDDVIMKDRQEKKQQKQTRDGKRSQGINKRSGPIRNTSSGRGGAHRKSPTQGRRDTNSPWKHDLYEQGSNNGRNVQRTNSSTASSIISRLGSAPGSNTIKVENLHYEVTEADVNPHILMIPVTIQELFKLVGPCSAKLLFDRSGRSNGVANVKFDNAAHSKAAFEKYNNVELDGQPMKITIVEQQQRAQGILSRLGQRK